MFGLDPETTAIVIVVGFLLVALLVGTVRNSLANGSHHTF